MRKFDPRYASWGAALLLLTAAPAFAGFVSLGWELSQMAGLVGSLACIALCGSPIRPRDSVPPTLLSLRLHTLIGWAALMAVIVHVGGLVLADHTVVEYLKFTTPLYQLAGIAASILLLVVILSSIASAHRLWATHRGFQATHVILSCLLAALIAVHVITTDRYVGGVLRRALLLATTIGAMLMLLRFRRPRDAAGGASRAHQLVFGRHSTLVLSVVVIIGVALAGLLRSSAVAVLREPLISRANTMPLDFPHGKHFAVNCLKCHHNYADGRGFDGCVACHRSSRADLKEGVEARFHSFCFDCHRHPPATFKRHGPVSGCAICHRPPDTAQQFSGPGKLNDSR